MHTDANVKSIIVKWYQLLEFKSDYDAEFYRALDEIYVDKAATVEAYDKSEENGKKNFLHFLYFCEKMEADYRNMKIPHSVFLDTVKDLAVWTDIWSEVKGELYLGELTWLGMIFSLRIIKLGRLQYARTLARVDIPEIGIRAGDAILEIHIPARGKLLLSECLESLDMARKFFPEFYPDFDYKCFTCHSWLLDTELSNLLPKESNILKFQTLFDIFRREDSNAILGFVIRWKITPSELGEAKCKSKFANSVKEAALSGRKFSAGYGMIKK